MSSQTSILNLPPEVLEMIFQKINSVKDLKNCEIACEVYTDPRISNILCQIKYENDGMYFFY